MTEPTTEELVERVKTYLAGAPDGWMPNSLLKLAAQRLSDLERERADLEGKLGEARRERDEASNWTALVDEWGTDRFDDLAERWLRMDPIQRMFNAVASVFSKWANDELIGRFKERMSALMQQAFVEGCLVGVRASEALWKGRLMGQFEIEWVERAGGRKAQCPPDPAYPDGIEVDCTGGASGCVAQVPYPAEHLGVWVVQCRICGFTAAITAAGRPDDPRSVKVPCKSIGRPQ